MRCFRVDLFRPSANVGGGRASIACGYIQAETEAAARAMLPADPGLELIDVSEKLQSASAVES